ncbi:MAG: acyl-CoA/acyl-ACP dehydrogenase [Actinomycetota bacterium]|nr:acyl-CoA/acyl-ACP dehydrogenase [Actinomycetota bacterium]
MQFALTQDQIDLQDVVRSFAAERASEQETRRLMATDTGWDQKTWRQLAEMDLLGLALGTQYGGAGCGPVELGVFMEAAGASLLCSPYLSTVVLSASALQLAGDEGSASEYLPRIAAGELVATLAVLERISGWNADDIQTSATRSEGGWELHGRKLYVLDGAAAQLILVAARTRSGLSLFAVDGDEPGIRIRPTETLDMTRKQATVEFEGVSARLVGVEGQSEAVLVNTFDLAAACLAAEQVGGAQHAFDMAVDYAKIRHQFGRPIGSFQAIKHQLADVLLDVESARSTAASALMAADEGSPEFSSLASMAKAYCSDVFKHVAETNIQIHGGIGFTWEHPAHLYYRRACTDLHLLGDPVTHREFLATKLLA